MRFSVEVETESSLTAHIPRCTKTPGRSLTWDITVALDQVKLLAEPAAPLEVRVVEARKVEQQPPRAPLATVAEVPTATEAAKPPQPTTATESTMPRQPPRATETPVAAIPRPQTPAKKTSSARAVQMNVGMKKNSVVGGRSDASLEAERKLSQLMNPKGRKVTRMGDWLVFTEKVGVVTSQNGVQQVRESRVKINAEDLDRLKGLGF